MVFLFLLLSIQTFCVCGLELNVAQRSYQAQENQDLTLDWTFTPRPDPSLRSLFVSCDFFTDKKVRTVFELIRGVEISEARSEEFSGRVRCDEDQLKEGWIRLHVSSLRTEDSGWYICSVRTDFGRNSSRCFLRVSEARSPMVSLNQPEGLKVETFGWKDVVSKGGMFAGLVAVLVALVVLIISWLKPVRKKDSHEINL